ncbi:MAG: hypothetical protein ACQERZ_04620, partial [Fusobacteriota bacterium]
MNNKLIEIMRDQKNGSNNKLYLTILLSLIFGLVWIIVYKTGGTKYAWPHLIYIPLFLSSFFFKKVGGFLGGVISGILMGPLMPLDVTANISQDFINWSSRAFLYIIFGITLGVIFE